jgi:hypothetical protein
MPRVRSLDELKVESDAWPLVRSWIERADGAQAFPAVDDRARDTLVALQVTTASVLGAIAYHCAGLSVGYGWLRHLGCGSSEAGDGLIDWNASLGGLPLDPPLDAALVVALDVIGGTFAINAGGLAGATAEMLYLAPDTQEWMALGMGHSAFVEWTLSANLDRFYSDFRWRGWQQEIADVKAGQAIAFYPPLGFEAKSLDDRTRRRVPSREIWYFVHELAPQVRP